MTMNAFNFKETVNSVIDLAKMVLPNANSFDNPQKQILVRMGCIPDTYEWLALKISFLEEDDIKGLYEWTEYIKEKGNAYYDKLAAEMR